MMLLLGKKSGKPEDFFCGDGVFVFGDGKEGFSCMVLFLVAVTNGDGIFGMLMGSLGAVAVANVCGGIGIGIPVEVNCCICSL